MKMCIFYEQIKKRSLKRDVAQKILFKNPEIGKNCHNCIGQRNMKPFYYCRRFFYFIC